MNEKNSFGSLRVNKEIETSSKIEDYQDIQEKLDNPDPKQSVYEAEKISGLEEKLDNLKEEIIEDYLVEQNEEYSNLKKKLDEGDYIKDKSDAYIKDQAKLLELRKTLYEKSLKDSNLEYKKLKEKLDDADYIKDNTDAYRKDLQKLKRLEKGLNNSLVDNIVSSKLELKKETLKEDEKAKLNTESSNISPSIEVAENKKVEQETTTEEKKTKEIIELTDIVSDEEMDHYKKLSMRDLISLHKETNRDLEENKDGFSKKKLGEIKKINDITEFVAIDRIQSLSKDDLNKWAKNHPMEKVKKAAQKYQQENLNEDETKGKEEIIELTDIVSDEEMDHYRKMNESEREKQHNEFKQALETGGLDEDEINEIKKGIEIIEKVKEESNSEETLQIEKSEELQESWDNLEDTRNEYIRLHQSYLQEGVLSGVRSALGISSNREMSPELIEAKEKYDLAKKTYAKNEQTVSLEKIDANLSDEEKEKQKDQIKNKIFNIVVLDEQEYLQDARVESHPPKERGIFMKAYDRWTSLSKTQRLVYSTVMVAGIAGYASLAVPVTASAAALGMGGVAGKKLLRGTFGMLFSGLAGKIFDRQIAGKKEEIKQTADTETESTRQEFDLDNLEKIENQYKDTIEQEQKGNRNILIRKALVMGGAGMISAMGLGMADNAFAGTGVVDDTEGPLKSSVEDKPILEGGTPKETMDVLMKKESLPSNLDMSDWSAKKVANFNYLEEWREKWGAGEIISDKELGDAAGSSRQDKIIEMLEKKVKTNKLHEVAREIAKEQGTYRVYTDENGLTQEEYSTKGLKWNYKEKTWVVDKVNIADQVNSNNIEKIVNPDSFIETAQKGDSIWKMSEEQLEKHYGAKFTGLEESQKTYLIDAIKDKITD